MDNIQVNEWGQCYGPTKIPECDCHVHLMRKHCIKCHKLFKGITLIKHELCPDCLKAKEGESA